MKNIIEFEKYRKLLFSIAYRMLGSVMEAEDMVQETYYKWEKVSGKDLNSPKSFLTTIITNLCIDQLRSAKKKKETYVGTWLPEPIISDKNEDNVEDIVEISDSLSTAFLILLESLTPIERAVYLLHDIFGYEFNDISKFLNKKEDNCRQIAKRARGRIKGKERRFNASNKEIEKIFNSFVEASAKGNIETLMSLLEDDIVLYSDSGGKIRAARKPIFGKMNVARFIVGIHTKFGTDRKYVKCFINGLPGLKVYMDNKLFGTLSFHYDGNKIKNIFVILNPEKLRGMQ
jgi:RNA polymerase sigma-70 factor (ECF subfamily)